jgi:hypothetical protein
MEPEIHYCAQKRATPFCKNYWVFGLCLSSGIIKIREHNVSETGSLSVLR